MSDNLILSTKELIHLSMFDVFYQNDAEPSIGLLSKITFLEDCVWLSGLH